MPFSPIPARLSMRVNQDGATLSVTRSTCLLKYIPSTFAPTLTMTGPLRITAAVSKKTLQPELWTLREVQSGTQQQLVELAFQGAQLTGAGPDAALWDALIEGEQLRFEVQVGENFFDQLVVQLTSA